MASGKASKAIFWATPGFKERTIHDSGSIAEGTLISAPAEPTAGSLQVDSGHRELILTMTTLYTNLTKQNLKQNEAQSTCAESTHKGVN